ncbi:hypothetical protein NBRC3299_2719 [Acetobacter pasteurianus NBRC 3299]|jgi:hypothetical protein|nr:hypothetical protein NBRC3299_2719 [Acetobacter pasteurianus NBRC 3299]
MIIPVVIVVSSGLLKKPLRAVAKTLQAVAAALKGLAKE